MTLECVLHIVEQQKEPLDAFFFFTDPQAKTQTASQRSLRLGICLTDISVPVVRFITL